MKKIFRKSAEGDSHAVFLFTGEHIDTDTQILLLYSMFPDTQIKEENFLEDIGNLLNTGEVPNMFPIDEKNEICSKMRQIDKLVTTRTLSCRYHNIIMMIHQTTRKIKADRWYTSSSL